MSLAQCAWAVLSNAVVSVWAWDCGASAGGVWSPSCRMGAPSFGTGRAEGKEVQV